MWTNNSPIRTKKAEYSGSRAKKFRFRGFGRSFGTKQGKLEESSDTRRDVFAKSFPLEFYLSSRGGTSKVWNEEASLETSKQHFPFFLFLERCREETFRNTPLFTFSSLFNYATWWEFARAYARGRERTLSHIRQMPQVQRGTKGKSIRLDLNRV